MFKQYAIWLVVIILTLSLGAACFQSDSASVSSAVSIQDDAPPSSRVGTIHTTELHLSLPIIVVPPETPVALETGTDVSDTPLSTPTILPAEEDPLAQVSTRLAETVIAPDSLFVSDTPPISATSVLSSLLTLLNVENISHTNSISETSITSSTRPVPHIIDPILVPNTANISTTPISLAHDLPLANTVEIDDALLPNAVELDSVLTQTQENSGPITAPLALPADLIAPAPFVEPVPDGALRTARIPVLMYHYVSIPPADANVYRQDLSVPPALFAEHLDAMQAAGYTAISLYDLYAHLVAGAALPEKAVVLTFDDGYRDVYENAFPLLRAHNMKATLFIVTDFIDEARPEYLTWDMARQMLAAGISIESHGRNHISMKNKDADYLVWQALGSLETIQYELGVRPRFVSYPAGEYDQQTIDIFQSADYWAGFTTIQGATHHSDDLFQLHRVRIRGTTQPDELIRLLELDW